MDTLIQTATFCAVAGACLAGTTGYAEKSAEKPNIIIFLVDDMGVMDTSVPFLTDKDGAPKRYPLNDWYRTPNMQRLADQGIRFSTFYAQSVCSPTRASIMTGQNATRHGTTTWISPFGNNRGKYGPKMWNWEGIKKDDVTLPKVLSSAGYKTIHVGKAHFAPVGYVGSDPLNIGFDVNVGGAAWGQPKSYYGKDNYGNHPKYRGQNGKKKLTHNVPNLEKYYGTDTFLTEALTLEANQKIKNAVTENKPFFLNMAHYALHAPFCSDPRFAEHYKDSDKSKGAKAFATLVEGMDKSLGDIMDQLDRLGVGEDTLIVFLGDNGSDAPLGNKYDHTSSAPIRGKKGTHYEGGTRVPFIAAWAQSNPENKWQKKLPIPQGALQNQFGTVMDIYPTLLALTGIKNPAEHIVDGFNISVQLEGKQNSSRPETFLMHFPHSHRSNYYTAYRSGDWKLVYRYDPSGAGIEKHELFNLKSDPFENQNLVLKNPEKLQQMIKNMAKQLESENALYPIDTKGKSLKPKL